MLRQNNKATRCNKCGKPIIKKLNSRRFELLKFQNGKTIITKIEHSGNEISFECGKCHKETTFAVKNVKLNLSYAIASKKK